MKKACSRELGTGIFVAAFSADIDHHFSLEVGHQILLRIKRYRHSIDC
jgi:hypothetical protein